MITGEALVTGGGKGIGRAIARALTHAGARVTVLGRDAGALDDAVRAGDAASRIVADVTDDAAVHAVPAGPWDILVNNAGGTATAPFARTTRAAWDTCVALNLTAVFALTQHVLPGMVARGSGRVVSVASTAGLRGYPYVAAYCAAKHGVVGLTRALAAEVALSGVTVNAVCPGFTDTDLVRRGAKTVGAKTGRGADAILAEYARANPQNRLIEPDEVAAAVLFLCGPGSDAMNGQAIAVAGGEI